MRQGPGSLLRLQPPSLEPDGWLERHYAASNTIESPAALSRPRGERIRALKIRGLIALRLGIVTPLDNGLLMGGTYVVPVELSSFSVE